jgi:hypothetical protein
MSTLPVDTSAEGIRSMADTVLTYGPAAVFVICCIVLPILLVLLLRKDEKKYSWLYRGLIAVVVLFGLYMGFVVVCVWRDVYIVRFNFTMGGYFGYIQNTYAVASKSENLYFRRAGFGRDVHYDWKIVQNKPFEAGDKYIFLLGPASLDTTESGYECSFVYQDDFAGKKVEIKFNKEDINESYYECGNVHKKLHCERVGSGAVLDEANSQEEEKTGATSKILDFLLPSAFAEGNASEQIEDVIAMLYDFDPGIRVTGYDKLVELQGKALSWILETMDNEDEPLQVRLAAISALLAMPDKDLRQFTDSDVAKVVALTADPEEAFRVRAIRFLIKHRKKTDWNIPGVLQRQLAEAEAKGQERTMAWTARAMMEVLYNLGVGRKDAYSKKRIRNLKPIEDAVALFAEAWELRRYAYGDDIYFIKPLYGWGHALHDKAFFYRAAPDGSIPREFNKEFKQDPELVKAARDKFQEFLDAYDKCQDKDLYPHPHQLEKARKYIDNPVPESLWD